MIMCVGGLVCVLCNICKLGSHTVHAWDDAHFVSSFYAHTNASTSRDCTVHSCEQLS